jgi:hypothetical protein
MDLEGIKVYRQTFSSHFFVLILAENMCHELATLSITCPSSAPHFLSKVS